MSIVSKRSPISATAELLLNFGEGTREEEREKREMEDRGRGRMDRG